MDKKVLCAECGELINIDDARQLPCGDFICEDCFNDNYTVCERCQDIVAIEDTQEVSVGYSSTQCWCDYCADNFATECNNCGRLVADEDTIQSEDGYICPSCYEDDYSVCDNCGCVVHEDNIYYSEQHDAYYCEDCYDRLDTGTITGYHTYDHDWYFKGKADQLHLGVELELDEGGTNEDNAREILDNITDNPDLLFCTTDSSLWDGFEIVSMPSTLEYHLKGYSWQAGMDTAKHLGYTSHDNGRCGLHIHLDRKYMQNSKVDAELALAIMVSNNAEFFHLFSRRGDRTGYCSFHYFEKYQYTNFLKYYNKYLHQLRCVTSYCDDHSNAINFGNQATIELRFFRGTLKYNTFVASLQLAQMMCDIVKNAGSLPAVASVTPSTLKAIAKNRGYKAYLTYIAELAKKEVD